MPSVICVRTGVFFLRHTISRPNREPRRPVAGVAEKVISVGFAAVFQTGLTLPVDSFPNSVTMIQAPRKKKVVERSAEIVIEKKHSIHYGRRSTAIWVIIQKIDSDFTVRFSERDGGKKINRQLATKNCRCVIPNFQLKFDSKNHFVHCRERDRQQMQMGFKVLDRSTIATNTWMVVASSNPSIAL